jgi:hypothetical protein
MSDENTVVIPVADGIARLSGLCTNGLMWTEYNLEPYDDGPISDTCSICDAEITSGWLCLDGGEVVCDSHVTIQARAK